MDAFEATARAYDELLAPALFQPLAWRVAQTMGDDLGASILDVGCGGGALARELGARAGTQARVVGVDANPGMLAVSRRNLPAVRFHEADAASMPFDSGFSISWPASSP